jgi:hypothetical protein
MVTVFMFIIGACEPTVSPVPRPTATARPMLTLSPTSRLTSTGEPQTSEAPTSLPQPTSFCETHTASVVLTASAESVEVGDALVVTVTLNNEGCTKLGLPQYRLSVQSDKSELILVPNNPKPVIHYLAVAPGQSDATEFHLEAVAVGEAILTSSVSFEVHLGYPGPAYWGGSSGEPLIIIVAP